MKFALEVIGGLVLAFIGLELVEWGFGERVADNTAWALIGFCLGQGVSFKIKREANCPP